MQKAQQCAIACDTTVFSPAERERFTAAATRLLQTTVEVVTRPDGYALRFEDAPDLLPQLLDFFVHDRQCCPFIRHTLDSDPNGGPLWLGLGGSPAAQAYIASELVRAIPAAVAQAAGLGCCCE
ncbi:MAG: hypothetical protein JKY37_16565 [Nannocystaceae bacterium]|nr:hypothetical protein [Nannocystaceae bacterium]